jgi:hypothetical protein
VKPLSRQLFLWLIVVQAAHSVEEYLCRLYDVLAPARWVSGLITDNLAVGFALANTCIVLLGLWCYLARVRTSRPSARAWAWFWAALEAANGAGHLAFAAGARGYFPGAATAPALLALSLALAISLRRTAAPERGVT